MTESGGAYAMAEGREEYNRARRRGQKAFSAARARGNSGYLPMLDARREECGVLALMSQPTRPISLNRIVGTYQSSRAKTFAANFMPLLPDSTEFADKWIALCAAHLETGIRDPIRVYEYLWEYYVVEGNKRVSVLKYFGATAFEAEITRLIPQWDGDDPHIARYYTFLSYAKKGVFPDIALSQPGKYDRLYRLEQRLIGELCGAQQPDYNMMYIRFESAFLPANCTLSLGDAFVEYLHIYGFPTDTLEQELTERIRTLMPQLDILEHPTAPQLVMEAEEEPPPLFTRLLSGHKNPKIVFAYMSGRTEHNWLGAHERGRLALQETFGDRIVTARAEDLDRDNAYDRLVETAGDAGLLFVTSPSLMNPVLRFALEHPDCLTLVCSRMQRYYRLHTYYGRYYEAVFICGVMAGLYTKTGVVAYVTPQLAGTRYTSDVNAFAIGVRTARPDAQVLFVTRGVLPADLATCEQAVALSANMGADVAFTPHYAAIDLPGMPQGALSMLVGLNGEGRPERFLAAPDWNWERFYVAIVKSYLNGSLGALLADDRDESPLKSFWWGLGAGVLDVRFGDWPEGASNNLLRYLKGSIARNLFNPFHGPVTDQDGALRIPAHREPAPSEIMNMRYLIDFLTPVG